MSIFARLMTSILRGSGRSRHDAASACAEGARLLREGCTAQARAQFERALSRDPDSFAANSALGVLLNSQGDTAAALEHLRRALQVEPRSRELALLAAQLLRRARRLGEARALLASVANDDPLEPTLGYEMARIERESGELDAAARRLERLLERSPEQPGLLEELAIVHRERGEVERALRCYERIAALLPDRARAGSAVLFHRCYLNVDRRETLELHRRWGQRFAPPAIAWTGGEIDPDPERRLRIGYVSADFGLTSASPFIEPLLAYRDRDRFEVVCYQVSGHDDPVTRRLRALADAWCDADRMDDETLASRIREDRIDILLDLNGHTRGGRLVAFARRPAPVQVAYLGYGATTGVAAIEHRITDAYIDPPGEAEPWYTENLVRLPGSMWCYTPPRGVPEVRPRPSAGGRSIVFGSFNNFAKVGPELIECWAAIGAQAGSARFVLAGVPQGEARRWVREQFARGGVAGERLSFQERVDAEAYYALFEQVDVALDAFPYNGGTTTCDALWMGVPVLTLAGESTLARSGVSLLTAAGLEDWVVRSKPDYVARACALAREPGAIAPLRASLRRRVADSRLCDARRFASEFDQILRGLWRSWCARATMEKQT